MFNIIVTDQVLVWLECEVFQLPAKIHLSKQLLNHQVGHKGVSGIV